MPFCSFYLLKTKACEEASWNVVECGPGVLIWFDALFKGINSRVFSGIVLVVFDAYLCLPDWFLSLAISLLL